MESFEKCCRLCAKEHEASIMIFGAETASMRLQNKLNKYLLIEVDEDDKLPKSICTQCCKQLQHVCEFIDKTRDAQEVLHRHSLFYEQLKHIQQNNKSRTLQITNITFQGAKEQIETKLQTDVMPEFAEITYIHGAEGESVTLTRNKSNINDVTSTESPTEEPNEKPFACLSCKRKFLTEFALKNHAWIHSPNGVEQTYLCTICNKSFTTKNEFLAHFKEHKHSRYCPACKRTLTLKTTVFLWNHIVAHSDEKPFQCSLCKKRFKRGQQLRFHINKHTGARPFKCPKCDKRFSSSGNCYSHKVRMHPLTHMDKEQAEKKENLKKVRQTIMKKMNTKYKCQVCSHIFNKLENFTYHMYKHTGVKPYHCLYCEESFVTRRGLQLHYENKHPGKERPLSLLANSGEEDGSNNSE